jgi:hypothetical protein
VLAAIDARETRVAQKLRGQIGACPEKSMSMNAAFADAEPDD